MPRVDIDDYELGPVIGSGTVGSIYQTTKKATGETLALKILSPAISKNELVVSRFAREMMILEKLAHPNILTYYGGGSRDGQLFYLMELVHGGTLKDLLAQGGPMPGREAAEVARQVAAALQHAHNHGVIHRDLKPGNVFVTEEGSLKLGDFGIAFDMRAQDQITDAGLTVGTYAYMAPELIRGQRGITGQVDLYALGCLLFEMLTGQPPYMGDNFARIFDQHLKTPPPRLSKYGIECPPRLEELIVRLLAKRPEDRPFNARTVQGILGELLAQESPPPTPEDKAAGDVSPSEIARAAIAARLRQTTLQHDVSWSKLGWLVAAVLAVLVVVLLMNR